MIHGGSCRYVTKTCKCCITSNTCHVQERARINTLEASLVSTISRLYDGMAGMNLYMTHDCLNLYAMNMLHIFDVKMQYDR